MGAVFVAIDNVRPLTMDWFGWLRVAGWTVLIGWVLFGLGGCFCWVHGMVLIVSTYLFIACGSGELWWCPMSLVWSRGYVLGQGSTVGIRMLVITIFMVHIVGWWNYDYSEAVNGLLIQWFMLRTTPSNLNISRETLHTLYFPCLLLGTGWSPLVVWLNMLLLHTPHLLGFRAWPTP